MTYILFYGYTYYPCGGWEDEKIIFAAKDDETAIEIAYERLQGIPSIEWAWAHLVNVDNLTQIWDKTDSQMRRENVQNGN